MLKHVTLLLQEGIESVVAENTVKEDIIRALHEDFGSLKCYPKVMEWLDSVFGKKLGETSLRR